MPVGTLIRSSDNSKQACRNRQTMAIRPIRPIRMPGRPTIGGTFAGQLRLETGMPLCHINRRERSSSICGFLLALAFLPLGAAQQPPGPHVDTSKLGLVSPFLLAFYPGLLALP